MYTIDKNYTFEQIIQKSRFICYLFPIKSVEEATFFLSQIRKKHYDASHNCYSFIIGDNGESARNSDDGEPSQTAGIVIYEVLRKNNLTNVLAIVTRYFGGIKLGAGGLIRAYGSSVSKTLLDVNLIKIEKMINVDLEFEYIYLNEILKLFNNYQEIKRDFTSNIKITYKIPILEKKDLEENMISKTKGTIKYQFYV